MLDDVKGSRWEFVSPEVPSPEVSYPNWRFANDPFVRTSPLEAAANNPFVRISTAAATVLGLAIFPGNAFGAVCDWRSSSFTLSPGALVVSFKHEGDSRGKLVLVPDKPGITDRPKTLFNFGKCDEAVGLWRVVASKRRYIHPGTKYHLEVFSGGKFACNMLQPTLGQAAVQFPCRISGGSKTTVAGPFRVGSKPVMAELKHDGGGQFYANLISVDGTDECEVVKVEGQAHLEQLPLEVKTGKEYLLYAGAGGDWELELTEGY